ncbi:MAG TPA: shikimate dehydrogenase [Acidobacteriota bacterium]|nr:shikimate dehydrogenase [Acidobacteriota bacterium]
MSFSSFKPGTRNPEPGTRICTPILSPTLAKARQAIAQAQVHADWIELRLDFLEDLDRDQPRLTVETLLAECSKPVIITFRPTEQGGHREISLDERLAFWHQVLTLPDVHFDLEADFVPVLVEKLGAARLPWDKMIASWHEFDHTPENLPALIEQRFPRDAATIKLAVRTTSIRDLTALLATFQTLAAESRQRFILIGMGAPGAPTRILGPALGSQVTYSAAPDGNLSAPGQFSAADLRHLYRIHRLSTATKVTGLIGKPVGHSLSPHMHNAAFEALGLDWIYLPFEVQPEGTDLADFIHRVVHPKTRQVPFQSTGFSVTIPHKQAVIPLLDSLTTTAEAVGAVNTLLIEGTRLIGHNTDVDGAMRPLEKRFALAGSRVAVLGAGGSAHALVYGLVQRQVQVTLFARNQEKARSLADKFGIRCCSLEDFCGQQFEGAVNCTPLGMHGTANPAASPLTPEQLGGLHWMYDLIYRPRLTPLLAAAQAQGIATLDGLEMLVEQARLQFATWTGQEISFELMFAAAQKG